jgi:tetratricopeptide (TPR) repeat protein
MINRLVISYSDDDRNAAERIYRVLHEEGFKPWISHEDIKKSVDWMLKILEEIDCSDGLVLVWSENASKSDNVLEEIRIARAFKKPIFPLLPNIKRRFPTPPEIIQSLEVIDEGGIDKNISELVARLRDPKRSKITFPNFKAKGHIPKPHNPFFVGRNSELKTLFIDSRGYLGNTKKGIPIVISGLAGIGKTDLALEFAYRFNYFFPDGVYWVEAQNGIVNEYEKIGSVMGIGRPSKQRPVDYALRVKEKLDRFENGLVIFDNVTDINEFTYWCPSGGNSCSVILTTRTSISGFTVKNLGIMELDPESAYALIISRRDNPDKLAADSDQMIALKDICHCLGNHPLALNLCSIYLQDSFSDPIKLRNELALDPFGFVTKPDDFKRFLVDGNENLLNMLTLQYKAIKNREIIDNYFYLLCWFAPHQIDPKMIISSHINSSEWYDALSELKRNSLIQHENDHIVLHPLVAQFGISWQQKEGNSAHEKFIKLVCDFVSVNKENMSILRASLPHIDRAIAVAREYSKWPQAAFLSDYSAKISPEFESKINKLQSTSQIIDEHVPKERSKLPQLYIRRGKELRSMGKLQEALQEYLRAEVLLQNSKPEITDVAALAYELGDLYLALGQYEKALKYLGDGLNQIDESKIYDSTAPEVTRIRQALARRLLYLGKYSQAEKMFRDILAERERYHSDKLNSESSHDVGSSYADLSRLALERGNYEEASKNIEKALQVIQGFYKDNEPVCANFQLHLATIYLHTGYYKQAEEKISRVLEVYSNTIGPRHPSYLRAMIVYCDTLRKLGQFDKSIDEIDKACALFTSLYREPHPFLIDALEIKGKILDHLCQFENEKQIWNDILSMLPKIYKSDHPTEAGIHYNIGNLYLKSARYVEAVWHLDKALTITRRIFGPNHPEYYGRYIRLTTCYYENQDYEKTEKMLIDAVKMEKKIFSREKHPYVARRLQLQSEFQRRMGYFKQALESVDLAIAMKESLYEPDHPSVAEALEIKIEILHHQGEHGAAKPLIERALDIREKFYNPQHPEVGRSEHDWGVYYLRIGQFDEAITHFSRAQKIVEALFGQEHPDYIERSLQLANALYGERKYQDSLQIINQLEIPLSNEVFEKNHYLKARWLVLKAELFRRFGRYPEALAIIEEAESIKTAIYGPDHPSVADSLEVKGKIYNHLGKFKEEDQVWKAVLKIQKNAYSFKHPAVALTYYNYANYYQSQGLLPSAISTMMRSLAITRATLGKNHAEFYGRLLRLASYFYDQQEYKSAINLLEQANEIARSIFGNNNDPYVAEYLVIRSEVHRRMGEFRQAESVIEDALDMLAALHGKDHPKVADALEVKVKILHHLGVRKNAKTLIDQTLRIRRHYLGKNHPAVGRSEHDLGSYYLRIGQFQDAIIHFIKARDIIAGTLRQNHPDYIESSLYLVNAYNEQGQYREALLELNKLSDILEQTIPQKKHYLKARRLQLLAELQRRHANFGAALKFIQEAIEMKIEIYQNELHPSVAEALEIKGKIHDHLCQFASERAVWEKMLKIQYLAYSSSHPAIALTLYNYANYYLRQGKFDDAIIQLDKSIKITIDALGMKHQEYYGRLVRLATCYHKKQDSKKVATLLKNAETLERAIFQGKDHPYVARKWQLESEYLHRSGRIAEALRLIDDTIAMKERIYGLNHPSVAEALEIKVDFLLDQLHYKDIPDLLTRIEKIRLSAYSNKHPLFADYLIRSARYSLLIGKYDDAKGNLDESLKILKNLYPRDHPDIIERIILAARLARLSGYIDQAENHINEARRLLGVSINSKKYLASLIFQEEANIARKKNEYKKSLVSVENALALEKDLHWDKSPAAMELIFNKIQLLVVFERFPEAHDLIEATLKNISSDDPAFSRLKADMLGQQGMMERSQNKFTEAIASFDAALELKKSVLGEDHLELAKLYIEKAVALRLSGEPGKALAYLERALNINNLYFKADHLFFARIRLEKAWALLDKKDYISARKELGIALDNYKAKPSQDLREHAHTHEAFARYYKETGFSEDAIHEEEEAEKIRSRIN